MGCGGVRVGWRARARCVDIQQQPIPASPPAQGVSEHVIGTHRPKRFSAFAQTWCDVAMMLMLHNQVSLEEFKIFMRSVCQTTKPDFFLESFFKAWVVLPHEGEQQRADQHLMCDARRARQ